MNLIYLSSANLADRLFIKDFVFNFKWKTPTIVIHERFGQTQEDTYFVTKRISGLLSEAMVYNNAFSAAQRGLFRHTPAGLTLSRDKIEQLLNIIPLLVLSPMAQEGENSVWADALEMLKIARATWQVAEITLYPENPLSFLGSKKPLVTDQDSRDALLKLYEEETATIQRAYELAPARICSPVNYAL